MLLHRKGPYLLSRKTDSHSRYQNRLFTITQPSLSSPFFPLSISFPFIIHLIHPNPRMEKPTTDTNELVDYNEEEDVQLAVAPAPETEDTSAK